MSPTFFAVCVLNFLLEICCLSPESLIRLTPPIRLRAHILGFATLHPCANFALRSKRIASEALPLPALACRLPAAPVRKFAHPRRKIGAHLLKRPHLAATLRRIQAHKHRLWLCCSFCNKKLLTPFGLIVTFCSDKLNYIFF